MLDAYIFAALALRRILRLILRTLALALTLRTLALALALRTLAFAFLFTAMELPSFRKGEG